MDEIERPNGQTDPVEVEQSTEFEAREKLKGLSEKAIKTLEQIMDSRNPREARQAAETVLNRIGLSEKGPAQFAGTRISSYVIISALTGINQVFGQREESSQDVSLIEKESETKAFSEEGELNA